MQAGQLASRVAVTQEFTQLLREDLQSSLLCGCVARQFKAVLATRASAVLDAYSRLGMFV